MPPAYVAWHDKYRVVVKPRQAGNRFMGSLKGLQIRALYYSMVCYSCLASVAHVLPIAVTFPLYDTCNIFCLSFYILF